MRIGIMFRLILALVLSCLPVKLYAGNILILGDSLSDAYQIPQEKSWPELLDARLSQKRPLYRVINKSESGRTTAGGLAQIPALMEEERPEIVILELGANDGLRAFPIPVIFRNLEQIINTIQAGNAQILLTGVQLPTNYEKNYRKRFTHVFQSLADRYELSFLPFILEGVHDQPGLMLRDRIHPSVKGQPVILDNIWPVLEPMLD
ncbi:MAG: arylesterase [Arenicellales bacterium]|nr:arylesterase [Arenicellales bacterium]